jgi:putative FmdB family regulatory protein
MPIYEYLCPACNRVFNFLSQSFDPEKQPSCPKCGSTDMEKMISRFAFVRSTSSSSGSGLAEGGPDGPGGPGGDDPLDDPRVEREMMRLMSDMEHIDENDPRQLGTLMRRMSEITGEPLDEEMEEAVRRLEAGEDPEKIEEDMGDLLGGDEMGGPGMGMGMPSYDEGLYPL